MLSKDGFLYGRGTSDNKGPILAMAFAVKELLDRREGLARGGLGVNLAFVFEGALVSCDVQCCRYRGRYVSSVRQALVAIQERHLLALRGGQRNVRHDPLRRAR